MSARLSAAKTYSTQLFTVKIAKNTLEYNRFGFIVTKKIDKRAVGRNRLKRQLRSCIENILQKMITGYDFLFFLKKEGVEVPTALFCQTLEMLFTKERLFL